jgi:hypothetical protein
MNEDKALEIEKAVYAKVFGSTPAADNGLQHGAGCPCYGCSVQDT